MRQLHRSPFAFVFIVLLVVGVSPAALAAPKLEQFSVPTDDGLTLALWAREVAKPKGVIVLLHGRTWSALPDFDLQVPGEQRSVMQSLNARGYSAFALDMRGYGKTPRALSDCMTERCSPGTCKSKSGKALHVRPCRSTMTPFGFATSRAHTARMSPSSAGTANCSSFGAASAAGLTPTTSSTMNRKANGDRWKWRIQALPQLFDDIVASVSPNENRR